MKRKRFVGWIPNVAGRLSFSHLGNTRNPGLYRRHNYGDGAGRLVICAQFRRVSDSLLASRYHKWVYDQITHCTLILVAHTTATRNDPQGALQGSLFFVDEKSNSAPGTAWKAIDGIVKHAARSEGGANNPAARALVQRSVEHLVRPLAFAEFDVTINRDGVVTLCPTSRTEMLQPLIGYDPSSEDITAGGIIAYVANQAFFFLKDVSHTHRHHASTSDTITTATSDFSNHAWIRETNYKLHRKIVQMRTSRNTKNAFHALGMLSYISSFSKTAKKYAGDRFDALDYNQSEIESAVKAHLELLRWQRTQKNIAVVALPTITLATLNFVGEGTVLDYVKPAISWLLSDSIAGLGIFTIITLQAPFYYGVWSYTEAPPIVRAKRILAALSAENQGVLWIFLGFIGILTYLLALIGGAEPTSLTTLWSWSIGTLALWSLMFYFTPYLPTIKTLWRKRGLKLSNRAS